MWIIVYSHFYYDIMNYTGDNMKKYDDIKRASILGILGNLFLLVIKMIMAMLTKSQSMLADSVNSAGDIISSLMTYIGNKIANKPRDEDHNLGHGKAVANATMEIPEAMIDTQVGQMVQEFAQRLQSQGLSMEQYFQFTGLTADKMKEEMRPQAVKRIETRLVLEAIAKAENIEISEEKLDAELAKMAEMYQMEVDKLKEYMGESEKEQMKADMAVQEAVTLLVDSAVEE